jgi:hypothetical protein
MSDNKEMKKIESKNSKGETVTVWVKSPGVKDYREAQLVYNKAFREALESGAILKQKLREHMKDQGVWDDVKEGKYLESLQELNKMETSLKSGGIPLKQARDIALQMRRVRAELNDLLAERQVYETNSVEGQADNVRFNHLVVCCVLNESGQRVWKDIDAYDKDGTEDWANEAASELANRLYGLDPDYYKNLTENEFLVQYKFANDDLRLINKEGHLVDSTGRLINEEGRYVAYRDGEQYFVNSEGKEITKEGDEIIEFKPFLDDEGAPITLDDPAPEVENTVEATPKKRKSKAAEVVTE